MGKRHVKAFHCREYTDGYKHMKRSPTKLKPQWEITTHLSQWLIFFKKTVRTIFNSCWKECGKTGSLIHCWWEFQTLKPLWKPFWQHIRKLNMKLQYDRTVVLLDIYPKEMKTCVHTKICTKMFKEA